MGINDYLNNKQDTISRYMDARDRKLTPSQKIEAAVAQGQADPLMAEDIYKNTQLGHVEPKLESNLAKDLGIYGAKGGIGVVQGLVGIADLIDQGLSNNSITQGLVALANGGEPRYVAGGRVGKALEDAGIDLKGAMEYWGDKHSEQHKDALAQLAHAGRNVSIDAPDGTLAKGIYDSFGVIAENPLLATGAVIQSAPSIVLGGAVTKGANAVVNAGKEFIKRAGPTAKIATPTAAPLIGGAIGEGITMAGTANENIRSETESGYLTPAQQNHALIIGGVGAGVGHLGSGIASRLGVQDIDNLVAGQVTGKGTKGLIVGTGLESIEEGLQTTGETILQNNALDKDPFEGLAEGIALGATAGGIMGAGSNIGGVATDAKAVVNKGAQAVAEKLTNTETFENYADPNKENYNPAKAYDLIKAQLGSDVEGVRKEAETKLQKLEDEHTANIKSLEHVRGNLIKGVEATKDDPSIAEDHAEFVARLEKVNEVLALRQKEAQDLQAAKADHQNKINLASTTPAQVKQSVATPKATGQEVIDNVTTFHAQLSDEDIKTLRDTNGSILTDAQGVVLRKLEDAKISENALKGLNEVSQEVINGKQGSTPQTSNRGTKQYTDIVMSGIKAGNTNVVEKALDDLQTWTTNYIGKATAAQQVWDTLKAERKSDTKTIDPVQGAQIIADGDNNWKIITDPVQFVPETVLKEMGGARIHNGSGNLVQAISMEADHVTKTNNALSELYDLSQQPQAQGSSQTPPTSVDPNQAQGTPPPSTPTPTETPPQDPPVTPQATPTTTTTTDTSLVSAKGKPVSLDIERDESGQVVGINATVDSGTKALPQVFQGTDAEVVEQVLKAFPKVFSKAPVTPTPPNQGILTPEEIAHKKELDFLKALGISENTEVAVKYVLDKIFSQLQGDYKKEAIALAKVFLEYNPSAKIVFTTDPSKLPKKWWRELVQQMDVRTFHADNTMIVSSPVALVEKYKNFPIEVAILNQLASLATGRAVYSKIYPTDAEGYPIAPDHIYLPIREEIETIQSEIQNYLDNTNGLPPHVIERLDYMVRKADVIFGVGLTEPEVVAVLKKMPVGKTTVYEKLKGLISKVLNITGPAKNMFERIVELSDTVAEIQQPRVFQGTGKSRQVSSNSLATEQSIEGIRQRVTEYIKAHANASASKHTPKELAKVALATKAIGQGVTGSSTSIYLTAWQNENLLNTGSYTSDDVVMLASNGNREGAVLPVVNGELSKGYTDIDLAIEAGASFVADTEAHLEKSKAYNKGELLLAEYLESKGYVRTTKDGAGFWTKTESNKNSNTVHINGNASNVPLEDGSLGLEFPKHEVLKEQVKPLKERNILKAHFTQKVEGNNPLVKVKDFIKHLATDVVGQLSTYMPDKYKVSNAQVEHVQDFIDFATKFEETLKKVFVEKNPEYRHEDLVQFIGTTNSNVNTAMALSAYSWMLQNGGNIYAENDAIATLLHLPDNTIIPFSVRAEYRAVGSHESSVVNSLGRTAYSALQLKADPNSDHRYEGRMQTSMGALVYATMLEMGIVERVTRTGFDQLKALRSVDYINKTTHAQTFEKAPEFNKKMQFFYARPKRNWQTLEPAPIIAQTLDMSKDSKGILKDVFKSDVGVTFPVFEKPTEFKQSSIARTKSVPSTTQAELVKESQEHGFSIREQDAHVFETLYNTDKDFLLELGGITGSDAELSKLHVSQRDDALAAAKNSQRVLEHAIEFLGAAKNEDGTYKEFWDTQHLAANNRMHYSAQGFNVQAHQTHRVLAGLTSFRTEIDISYVYEGDTNALELQLVNENGLPTQLGVVFLSFAENFEGMENVKLFTDMLPGYDFHTWDKVPAADFLPAMSVYLSQEYVQDGIQAVQLLLQGETLTKEQKDATKRVVDEGGMGFQSLHALTSMAHLYNTIDKGEKTFVTSVAIGSDGINNGVAIAALQSGTISIEMLLQTGMIPKVENQTIKNYQDTKRHGVTDYYTAFAELMKEGLQNHIDFHINQILPTDTNNPHSPEQIQSNYSEEELTRVTFISKLFKSFGKRKGAKAWTIPFNYSAGFNALKRALAQRFIEDIYAEMVDIADLTQDKSNEVKYAQGLERYNQLVEAFKVMGIQSKLPAPESLKEWDFGTEPSGARNTARYYADLETLSDMTFIFGEIAEEATKKLASEYIVVRNRESAIHRATFEVYDFVKPKIEAKFLADLIKEGKLPKGTTLLSYDSISANDMKRLEKLLVPVAPYMRSPMSIHSKNDLEGGVYLAKSGMGISQTDRVSSVVNVGGKKTYLKPGLAEITESDRGVGGGALQVQAGDATVSAHTKAKTQAIGIHDADMGSPTNIDLVGKTQNETFFNMMKDYDAKGETFEALIRTIENMYSLTDEYGITDAEVNALLYKIIGTVNLKKRHEHKLLKALQDSAVRPSSRSIEFVLNRLGELAYKADIKRLSILENLYSVQQYGWEGSERLITDEDRKAIEKRKEEIRQKLADLPTRVANIKTGEGLDVTEGAAQKSRTFTPLQKWFTERTGQELKYTDVMNQVYQEASPLLKTVLKTISSLIPKDTKVVYFDETNIPEAAQKLRGNELTTTHAWYDAETGVIYVKSIDSPNGKVDATILTHELVHAALAQRLYGALNGSDAKGKQAVDRLNALREKLRSEFPNDVAMQEMTKNLDEFLSYGLTESALQEKMLKILVPREGRTKSLVSAFKNFLEGLMSIFGFTHFRGEQISMLQAFIVDSTALMESLQNVEAMPIPKVFHAKSTAGRVKNLDVLQVFNTISSTGVSSGHHKHLSSMIEALMGQLYKNDAQSRNNFDSITLGATLADRAGFSMSQAESYAAEAIKHAMDYYVDNHADKAMLTHVRKLYDNAKGLLTPQDFHNGVWAHATSQEKLLAKRKFDYMFSTASNDYLSRFASVALANEHIKNLLDSKVPASTKGRTWFEKLSDFISYVINVIDGRVAGAGINSTGSKRLAQLVSKLAEVDARGRQQAVGIIEKAWSGMGMLLEPLNKRGGKLGAKLLDNNFLKQSRFKILRTVGKVASVATSEHLRDLPEQMKILRDSQNPHTRLGEMAEILNEVLTPNALRRMMDKFIRQASSIQQIRQNIVDNTKKVVLGLFTANGANLSKEHHNAITYSVLRTDVQSLLNFRSEKAVMKLLEDPQEVNKAITDITKAIVASNPNGREMVIKAEMLGYYMVTGKGGAGLVKNAKGIADGLGTSYFVKDSAGATLINQLDQLATLYAMKHVPHKHKAQFKTLLKSENDGIRGLLQIHNSQVKKAAQDFVDNPYSMNKGYMPDIVNPNREIAFITDPKEREAMERMGWVFIGEVDRDPLDNTGARYIMVHSDKGYQRTVSGAVDLQNTARKGTLVYDRTKHATIAIAKARTAQRITHFDPTKVTTGLIASYDVDGNVLGYSYEMTSNTRDEYLERSHNFADLLGMYEGSMAYKPEKTKLNLEVADAVHADFVKNYKRNPNAYIALSPHSKDPKLVEIWRMLPHDFKERAAELYGEGQPIILNNEILNATVGFKKYSIATIWDKEADKRNAVERTIHALFTGLLGQNAQGTVAKYGHIWGEAVALAKDAIVIRSLSVLVGNVISNLLLLGLSDVNPMAAVRDAAYATRHARAYQEARNKIVQLELSKRLGTNLNTIDEEIRKYQDIIDRNPLKGFIEAGMLSSIVEDTMIQEADYTYMSSLEEKTDKLVRKVPKPIRDVSSWLMVSPSTPLYQTFATVTQYSDFTAKYSLYKAQVAKGVPHEEALTAASEAFINYDMPSSRGLQYANDIGLFMFTKFFLRFQHILMKKLETKSASTISQHLAVEYFTDMAGVLDPLFLNRIGNNPFELGAFGLPSAIGSIVTIDAAL